MLAPGLTGSKQDLAPEIQVRRRGSTLIQMILTTAQPSTMVKLSVSAVVSSKQERSSGNWLEGQCFRTNFLNFIQQYYQQTLDLPQYYLTNVNLCLQARFTLLGTRTNILGQQWFTHKSHTIKNKNLSKAAFMTPEFYFYQMRRTRPSNPTYNSNNVDQTCFSIYHGGIINSHNSLPYNPEPTAHHELKQHLKTSRGVSQLSNIGSSLLRIEDKDIYNRQTSKYDIISMQPVNHNEIIKKYPKFTVEDKDINYLRKMNMLAKAQESQSRQKQKKGSKNDRYAENERSSKEQIAGRHTYELDNKKTAVQLWESYQGKTPVEPRFRAKMLNFADQFRSFM